MKRIIPSIIILVIPVAIFIGAITGSLKSPIDTGKEEGERAKMYAQIDQDYQRDMAAKYRELEHKAWSGTHNDAVEFQAWINKHVRTDGSFE